MNTEQVSLFAPDGWSGKTCREPSAAERPKERTSASSWKRSSALSAIPFLSLDLTPGHGNLLGEFYWEMISPWRGGSWTLNTGPAPLSGGGASTLSQILQDCPPHKYYLSSRACLGILRRAEERGKALPSQLRTALTAQAGLTSHDGSMDIHAYHINQRSEGIDLCGISGALMRTQNMQMQTFVTQPAATLSAAFSAGAGPSAGSLGYQEEVAPTLKGTPGGSMMPAVLCLNDQGGSVMDCSDNITGTLRSQEHGHQPLVFDNHGKDARYTGPLDTAPTVVTAYGTGGNNVPLVSQTPLLIRRLTPLECERLQGYPDHFTALPGASDAARYRALGNSVAIPCVEFVMQGIVGAAGLSADTASSRSHDR